MIKLILIFCVLLLCVLVGGGGGGRGVGCQKIRVKGVLAEMNHKI